MFKSVKNVGILMALVNRLRLVVRLLRDSRVPVYLKFVPFLSLVAFALPIDWIPILGQVDELGMIMLAVEAFVRLAPQHVVYEHQTDIESGSRRQARAEEDVVEGEWRTVNRNAR